MGAHFVEGLVGTVPLIENLFDQVLVSIQTEADGPLVRFSSRVANNFEFHFVSSCSVVHGDQRRKSAFDATFAILRRAK